jgi:hypothetical protein
LRQKSVHRACSRQRTSNIYSIVSCLSSRRISACFWALCGYFYGAADYWAGKGGLHEHWKSALLLNPLHFMSPIFQLARRTSRRRARKMPTSACSASVASVATHTYLSPALHACKTNHATGTSSCMDQLTVWCWKGRKIHQLRCGSSSMSVSIFVSSLRQIVPSLPSSLTFLRSFLHTTHKVLQAHQDN